MTDAMNVATLEDLKQKLALTATPHDTGRNLAGVAAMLGAQAKASIEARFVIAMHRPRNWDDVRVKLLDECRRPAFANNTSTWYRKPIGKGVEGLGIRFVEVALRCLTNVLVETMILHDDETTRILRVSVTDLESNETCYRDVTVAKTVERSRPLEDGRYLSVRTNSQGQKTWTVPASDDDLLNKEGALVSKAIRTLGLRIIPGDLQDEAEAIILKIRKDKAAADPAGERKRIADAFAEINVRPSALTEYLGHDFGECSPAELVTLRGIYGAIRDGEATWAATLDEARRVRADDLAQKLKDKLEQEPKKKEQSPEVAPDSTPDPAAGKTPPSPRDEPGQAPRGESGQAPSTRQRVEPAKGMD